MIQFGTILIGQMSTTTPASTCKANEPSPSGSCNKSLRKPSVWIADNGASHHICPDKTKFKSLNYSAISTIRTVTGLLNVAKVGTVELIVDGSHGKETMVLENVLLQEESKHHVYSLQQARKQKYYYEFGQAAQGKIRLLQDMTTGDTRQVALLSEDRGKWTLDTHPTSATGATMFTPSVLSASAPVYTPQRHLPLSYAPLTPLDNSFSGRFDDIRDLPLQASQLPHVGVGLHQKESTATVSSIDISEPVLLSPHIFVSGGALGKCMHEAIDRAHVSTETPPLNVIQGLSPDEVVVFMALLAATDLVLLPTAAIHVVL